MAIKQGQTVTVEISGEKVEAIYKGTDLSDTSNQHLVERSGLEYAVAESDIVEDFGSTQFAKQPRCYYVGTVRCPACKEEAEVEELNANDSFQCDGCRRSFVGWKFARAIKSHNWEKKDRFPFDE